MSKRIWIGASGFVPDIGMVEHDRPLNDEQVRRMPPAILERWTREEAEPPKPSHKGDR